MHSSWIFLCRLASHCEGVGWLTWMSLLFDESENRSRRCRRLLSVFNGMGNYVFGSGTDS